MPPTISFTTTTATQPSARSIYHTRMSVTQTYQIAHQARGKLAKEANCPDHNLRRLVCHANMLDNLIFDLAHAEEEQEKYLNKLTSGEQKAAKKSKAEKWANIVMEKLEEECESENDGDVSESEESESEDDEFEHRENNASENATEIVIISPEEMHCANELHEEHARLALERTKSRSQPPSSQHAQSAVKSR